MTVLRLILFFLPLALLALWLYARRRAIAAGGAPAKVDARMIATLAVLIVAVLGLALLLSHEDAADRGAVYVPPHVEDGKVVPGRFEEAPEESPP